MLKIENINTFYGSVQALHDVSVHVSKEDIVAIIGANGAGKSTLMKSVMGLVRPRSGNISFKGDRLNDLKTHQIVQKGIVYVPEGREIFPDLSVQSNLEMGAYSRRYSLGELQALYEEMYTMFPRLKERRTQMAGSLSGGEQQMLAIARGLMCQPSLIMFDEPSLGLAPVIVDEMFDTIVRINKEKKLPVILVEQNAFMALTISQYCYVLENGRIKTQGKSSDLIDNDDIRKAYLGG